MKAETIFPRKGWKIMSKVITVKGVGRVSVRPDLVEISLSLYSRDEIYEAAMELAAKQIEGLNDALCAAGFEKKDLKTTDFDVDSVYRTVKDVAGNSTRVFDGYEVKHELKLSFDFDSQRLSTALSSIAGCMSNPDLSINFTVKDATAVKDAVLRSAAENAKRKAEILCEALGARLGELRNIDYSWRDINIYSHTRPRYGAFMAAPRMAAPDIEPDDIDASDSATFEWEIEEEKHEKSEKSARKLNINSEVERH